MEKTFEEWIRVFFKKRWARIGLPVIFWGTVFFAWDFLVEHQTFTSNAVIQGILTGPYRQFWYIYVLLGLYLVTPILRVVMAHGGSHLIKYLLILWVLGASLIPFASLFTTYYLDNNVLAFTGYAGYFILGAYLLTVRVRRSALWAFMSLGIALTSIGTYTIAATAGGEKTFFFQDYLSPTIILASVMLFLLLSTIQVPPSQQIADQKEIKPTKNVHPKVRKLLSVISQNTLPIFLFHLIILESFQRGYFGIAINGNTINTIIGAPLMTVITLVICLAIIIPLKKVPILKKLIG